MASRNIRINTFLTDQLTELPDLVKKGSNVLITAQSGAISVKMNGTALEDGVMGQQIRVQNVSSGRIVYGKVVSDSEVLVNY
jgi:flagella basal body P-ring formation protein FlgA